MNKSHNLQIESYNLEELMGLFHFQPNQTITVEDMKQAKKKVLMMHPDKSKLPKEYFLFYKKAFDIIVRLYDGVQKVSKPVENTEYQAESAVENEQAKGFRKNLEKISTNDFQKKFHTLFEKHAKKPINTEKYEWFSSEEPVYDSSSSSTIRNQQQMNQAIDEIKQRQQEMTLYKGVTSMNHYGGNSLYEDVEEVSDDVYYECDPFSKLKFDDVRKVHRDQTVIGVRESDMQHVHQYKTVEEYQRSRSRAGAVAPMERTQAQQMMDEQDRLLQMKMREKQYLSEQSTMRNMEMNKQVMANFLRLT